MKWSELTTDQIRQVTALLKKYEIEPDPMLDEWIEFLNNHLGLINILFDGDIEGDRKSIDRDNKRIKKIFKTIDEFENQGRKNDFNNSLGLFRPMVEHPYFLPASNEYNRLVVRMCSNVANVLIDRGYFKSRKKKISLYLFLASLVNILRPGTFRGGRFEELELTPGLERSFRDFLFTYSPNPPPKRKLRF